MSEGGPASTKLAFVVRERRRACLDVSTDVLIDRTADFLQRYSVEWSGFLVVHRPGVYRFTTTSDDGSRLAIDNRTVVFNRGVHGLQIADGLITLRRGIHPIWAQYMQAGGPYALLIADSRCLAAIRCARGSRWVRQNALLWAPRLQFGPVAVDS